MAEDEKLQSIYRAIEASREKYERETNERTKIESEIKKGGGDRAAVLNACGLPRHWKNSQDVKTASEWIIVPLMIDSKTYPGPSPATLRVLTDDAERCDYISVHFDHNNLKTIDRSKCKTISLRIGHYEDCYKILGY